jgi:outer membrane protein assembly factor BamB
MDQPSGWWMFHGDPGHTGHAAGSSIDSRLLRSGGFGLVHTLSLGGPILSTPAVCNGHVYVGLANSRALIGEFGGTLLKIELESGDTVARYAWQIDPNERDSHGFCGMGSTPTVVGGFVYFVAFNAKLYCLNESDLSEVWVTDLRNRDLAKNQPIENYDAGDGNPPASGWSAPLFVDGRLYLGIGEGENPNIFSFVFCLDASNGQVIWVICTNLFSYGDALTGPPNLPNVLPLSTAPSSLPEGFSTAPDPEILGASVWGNIAYDETLNRLYCPTGNGNPDGTLPTAGWTNGLLALDASNGEFRGFYQVPPESNYRPSDQDIDVGGSPTLFDLPDGPRVVGVGCKNGSYFILDADTLEPVRWRQLLPSYDNGGRIPAINTHGLDDETAAINPRHSNAYSDTVDGENYSGIYSTAAWDPSTNRLFVGLGGNNYHTIAPGIDSDTTPFMRALNCDLSDAWPTDGNDPPRYRNAIQGLMPDGVTPIQAMYSNANESGISVPAVVNDLVFMGTTNVSIYAFSTADGTVLWTDQLGEQTGGYSGGYGYCMGLAICGDYVVAGALVFGGDGGVLRIYGPTGPKAAGGPA